MSTAKTAILFTLGEPDGNHEDWQQYLQYGFEKSDESALIELLSDLSPLTLSENHKAAWVPLHAWRILGQLRSKNAILPLLDLFEALAEDDWALNELPKVMGMIGQFALAPLSHYVLEKNHDEFARATAMEALCEIAKQHPGLRAQVLEHYKAYIKQADTTAHALNGLLISFLLDMDAKELIEDIRELFNRQCVDITCAGNMEDIEMALGLRLERSTPKTMPIDYFPFADSSPRPHPETNDTIDLVDYYLDHYANDVSILGVSELDGYFAAIGCAPQMILPSLWMPSLWGGEEQNPNWESTEEHREFSEHIMIFYNVVMEDMNNDNYEAMYMEKEINQHTFTFVDEWCAGFLRGINLWGPTSPTDTIILEAALKPIRLFATECGFGELAELNDDEIEQRQQDIKPAVQKLFLYFYERRKHQNQPHINDTPKAGRNDLCPCGSGKKYKKCCLH